MIIPVKGGMVMNGSVSCGAESFGTGVGIAAGAAGTPKPRRSEGEGVVAGGDISHVEALSRSDVSVSSVECLQRSFQLGGSEPFRTASRVVKLSSNTRWNCGDIRPVVQFITRDTLPAWKGDLPT